MKKSKVVTGLVTVLAFTTQSLAAAAPQPSKDQILEHMAAKSVFISLNSTASSERALEALMAPEDVKEIKKFLESKKVDLSKLQMNDTPFFGGKIFYGNKVAEFQKDSSLRIDGHYYRYDKKLSPAQNYIRLFNAFNGRHETEKVSVLKKALLPEAAAAEPSVNPLLKGMDYATEANKAEIKAAAQSKYDKLPSFEKFRAEPSGKPPIASPAQAKTSWFSRAAARSRALFSTAGKSAQSAATRVGMPAISANSALVATALWGGVGLTAIWAANRMYSGYWHGVLSCKPVDPQTGRADYVFSFTGNDTWYWRSTDTRDFTSEELADYLGAGVETYEKCLLRTSGDTKACDQSVKIDGKTLPQNCTTEWAKDFTANHIAGDEQKIQGMRDWNKGGASGAGSSQ